MIKKLIILFKLGRKLAKSDILNIVSKFKKPPLAIKILFQILSFSFLIQKKLTLMSLKVSVSLNRCSQWEQHSLN